MVDDKGNIVGKKGKIPAWLRPICRSTDRTGKYNIPKNKSKFLFENPYFDLNLSFDTEGDYLKYLNCPYENANSFEIQYMRYIIHCAERNISPNKIAIEYFALVFSEILDGKEPEKALGLIGPGSGSNSYVRNYRKRDLCYKIDDMVNNKGYLLKDAIAEVACGWQSSHKDENPEETIRAFYSNGINMGLTESPS